jgi:hypothetical protein
MKNPTKICTKKERKERSDRRRTLRQEHMRINVTKVSGSWRGILWKQIYQAHFLDFEKVMFRSHSTTSTKFSCKGPTKAKTNWHIYITARKLHINALKVIMMSVPHQPKQKKPE